MKRALVLSARRRNMVVDVCCLMNALPDIGYGDGRSLLVVESIKAYVVNVAFVMRIAIRGALFALPAGPLVNRDLNRPLDVLDAESAFTIGHHAVARNRGERIVRRVRIGTAYQQHGARQGAHQSINSQLCFLSFVVVCMFRKSHEPQPERLQATPHAASCLQGTTRSAA